MKDLPEQWSAGVLAVSRQAVPKSCRTSTERALSREPTRRQRRLLEDPDFIEAFWSALSTLATVIVRERIGQNGTRRARIKEVRRVVAVSALPMYVPRPRRC